MRTIESLLVSNRSFYSENGFEGEEIKSSIKNVAWNIEKRNR